jgi:hypothetical protein
MSGLATVTTAPVSMFKRYASSPIRPSAQRWPWLPVYTMLSAKLGDRSDGATASFFSISADLPSYWIRSKADTVLWVLQPCAHGMIVPSRLCRFFTVALVRFTSVGNLASGVCRRAPSPFRRGNHSINGLATHSSRKPVVGGLFACWGGGTGSPKMSHGSFDGAWRASPLQCPLPPAWRPRWLSSCPLEVAVALSPSP